METKTMAETKLLCGVFDKGSEAYKVDWYTDCILFNRYWYSIWGLYFMFRIYF